MNLREITRAEGKAVVLGGSLAQFFQGVLLGQLVSRLGRKRVHSFIASVNHKDLVFIKELLEAGKVVPVIERCYPLSETAEAIQYLAAGHAPGKVVITVDQYHTSKQSPNQSRPGGDA